MKFSNCLSKLDSPAKTGDEEDNDKDKDKDNNYHSEVYYFYGKAILLPPSSGDQNFVHFLS